MTARARRILGAAAGATLALTVGRFTHAAPVDFSIFQTAQGIPTSFVDPLWSTPDNYNGISVPFGSIAIESTNADTTMFYGPSSLDVTNKIITGDLYAGADDDYIGIAIGVNADTSPMLNPAADYLLLQWKGLSQNFDFVDRLAPGEPGYTPFHDSTVGGAAPVGLSLSRVTGFPTADEFWQRADLTMYDPQGKRAPDPAVDPILGTPETDSGGLVELGRAAFYGDRSYGPRHQFEIHYTPENIKVYVDGALEFDVNADAGSLFPSGTLALYEQAQDPSGTFAFFDVRDFGDPAPPTAPSLIPTIPFGAADISVPESSTNAESTWTVVNSTPDPGAVSIVSTPNVADVDFAVGGSELSGAAGVLFATVRQNGPRANGDPADARYVVVEAPFDSGFGGVRAGANTINMNTGAEWNVDIAIAYFPYERFRGGYVSPLGTLGFADNTGPTSPYTITQQQVPLPSIVKYADNLDGTLPTELFFAGNQQVMTNVAIQGKNSQTDGLLFTISASNEDNYTSAAPLADGTWNVAVRDADSVYYGGPDTFEQDDFAFLYLEPDDVPGSVGGRVTGNNGGGEVEFAQSWGDFTLTRADMGVYELAIDGGDSFVINILGHALSGDLTFEDTDSDGDGTPDTRTFTDTQDLLPELVDSPFSFAFIPFEEGVTTGPGMLLLTPNGAITLEDGTVAPLNYWMTYELGTVPVLTQWAVDAGGNWSVPASWTGGAVPDGTDASAVLGSVITADRQIMLDAPVTLGSLRLDGANRYEVAGPSTLTLDVSAGSASISATGSANHVISAPLMLADDTTVHVAQPAATLAFTDLAQTTARITKIGAGTLEVNRLRAAALDVQAGTVRLAPGGGAEPNVSIVDELTLAGSTGAWASTLDLTDNGLVLGGVNDADDLARVIDQVRHARDEGTDGPWSGFGITSSAAADNEHTGLAVVFMFGSGNIVIQYTYNGDANLDGLINIDDYVQIDTGFLSQPATPTYGDGDFNYDGTIDIDDYVLIDSAFLEQGAPLTSRAAAAAAIASVPEPAAGGLVMLLALGAMSRRTPTAAHGRRRRRTAPAH